MKLSSHCCPNTRQTAGTRGLQGRGRTWDASPCIWGEARRSFIKLRLFFFLTEQGNYRAVPLTSAFPHSAVATFCSPCTVQRTRLPLGSPPPVPHLPVDERAEVSFHTHTKHTLKLVPRVCFPSTMRTHAQTRRHARAHAQTHTLMLL